MTHLTPTPSTRARSRTAPVLLAAVACAASAALPHVLASAAPASDVGTPSRAATAYGIWSDRSVPSVPATSDPRRVTLGLDFTSGSSGRLHGVQYYAAGPNRVATTGAVWNAQGRRIASVTFPATSRDGWKTATLKSPATIRAGERYTVSYRAPNGRYATERGVFTDGRRKTTRGSLTALRGTYTYGHGRPTRTSRGAHYFIDVVFTPTPTPTPTPTSTPTSSPTSGPTPTPTPTSTPTSSPTSTPTPNPPGWPSAANTGVPAGTSLVTVPGQRTQGTGWRWDGARVVVTQDNAVLDGLDVNGAVHNKYKGVTIKNSRVRCTGERSWCVTLGSGSTLADSEIGGGADGTTFQPSIGVLSGAYASSQATNVVQRVNIHHTVHGMRVDGNTTVADSYLHDFPMGDAGWTDAHTDGIMCTAGADVTIRHNRFESGNTAPFFVQWQTGNVRISGYTIEDNYFVGVRKNGQLSSYGVFFENKGIATVPVIRNNTFAGEFQAGQILAPRGSSVSGNVTTAGSPASVEYQ